MAWKIKVDDMYVGYPTLRYDRRLEFPTQCVQHNAIVFDSKGVAKAIARRIKYWFPMRCVRLVAV